MEKAYNLYLQYIDEWRQAVRIYADEEVPVVIYADSIDDAMIQVIQRYHGIKANGMHKLVCRDTGEFKIF